ncbi:RHS repeat-associated core domain-containing protein, partial [Ramlibacter sp.]|uniref:RHS repeat-associated core domain-containing protein n=1 Tax=Ramlibacter sp. TaxID=1917967 RepID=UPI003D0D6BB4
VWQWPYSAFGDNKPTGILAATPNPQVALTNRPLLLKTTSPRQILDLAFPGQIRDDESGLKYNGNRYYWDAVGRYPQADRLGLRGGLNVFVYGNNDPFSNTDPDGNLPQGVVDFSAGLGDVLLFGQGGRLREWFDVDGGVDPCSGEYGAGEWAGVAAGFVSGLAGGARMASGKAAGLEYSHWIPRRMLPESMRSSRTIWNGNYVPPARHYYHDPYRYPKGWRDFGPKWNPVRQQFDRLPTAFKGGAAGAGYGAVSASSCTCGK